MSKLFDDDDAVAALGSLLKADEPAPVSADDEDEEDEKAEAMMKKFMKKEPAKCKAMLKKYMKDDDKEKDADGDNDGSSPQENLFGKEKRWIVSKMDPFIMSACIIFINYLAKITLAVNC